MTASEGGVELVVFKPVERNTLRGFATVRLRATGLTIADVAMHLSHGRAWAALPSKPLVDLEGHVMRDAATGKVRYAPVLEWHSREVGDRFSRLVVEAVEERHPGAVGGADGVHRVLALA